MSKEQVFREMSAVSSAPGGTLGRNERAWGLGDAGYDMGEEPVVTVEYPSAEAMAAAERSLSFGVAMANAVEVVPVGQG